MRSKRVLFAFLLLPLMAVAVSCSSGSGSGAKSAASPTAQAQKLDLSKDDLGRAVSLSGPYKRIVAMSPSVVELLYAVGATPIGRPSSTDYPPEVKAVPDFGTAYNPNFEVIANMKPDLIIADAIIDASMIDPLSKLGAPVFTLKVASFDDVVRGLRVVGTLSGNEGAAETAAARLQKQLSDVQAKLPATGPSVLVLVNLGPGQFVAGKNDSYLGDILQKLHARNLVTTEPENFRFPGFTDYSRERILEKNPDVILAVTMGPPGTPTTSDQLKNDPALSTLSAVKNSRIYEVDPIIYVQSAGPRVSKVLDELPGILYPSVFKAN
jgi:iron complex transport system substrate-binding protein